MAQSRIVSHAKLVRCIAHTNSSVLTHVLLSLARGGMYVYNGTTFHTTKDIITIERGGVTMVYQYTEHDCADIVDELARILDIENARREGCKEADNGCREGAEKTLLPPFRESLVRDYVAAKVANNGKISNYMA